MPNAKAPSPNKAQSSNEMPKQIRHDKDIILNSFQNPFLKFGIWILTFELFSSLEVCFVSVPKGRFA